MRHCTFRDDGSIFYEYIFDENRLKKLRFFSSEGKEYCHEKCYLKKDGEKWIAMVLSGNIWHGHYIKDPPNYLIETINENN